MLTQQREACVVHVADVADGEALELLCRTTQVIAAAGVDHQVLIVLARDNATDLVWSAALPAEVRPLRCSPPSILGRIRALQAEFTRLSAERSVQAVHLHGLGPCLLGSRALKASPVQRRVLYSPHLARCDSPWAGLLTRLLQSYLQPLQGAAVTASFAEAQTLSKLFNRSAEVLPHPVSDVYFQVLRQDDGRPNLLADGYGREALDRVTRLSVLLNGREARVPFAWLGAAEGVARAQLDAAAVSVLALPEDAERAEALSRASAFIHVADDKRLPLAAAQAMAAGVPCLVSDTPSHRALVRHGETGFVCTSERDFLEKLVVLLRDPGERERIGQAARAEAQRRFTLQHFESALLRAYGLYRTMAVSHVH